MSQLESENQKRKHYPRWLWFFVFLALQSFLIAGWILMLPRDPKNVLFFGLSAARIGMVLAVLGLGAIIFVIAGMAAREESHIRGLYQTLWRRPLMFVGLESLSVLVAFFAWGGLAFLRSGVDGAANPVYIRLQPILLWLFALGLQGAVWFWLRRFGWDWKKLRLFNPVVRAAGVSFLAILISGLLIWVTKLGITPDVFLWGYPGVPLLAWQVVISLMAVHITAIIFNVFPGLSANEKMMDLVISLGLFLLAAGLWLSLPIPRSFFFPIPREPTFQIFPYSDAGFYDYTSQSILVGEGFLNGKIVTRPLYILFLAVLHGLGGQNYAALVVYQTLVLAIFPVVLYLLGRSIHSREAGMAAGLLVIFRELNTIAATPITEVSHSKMLMTDSLTGLGIGLFCLFVFRWLRYSETRPLRALVTGGFLGILLLLRSQVILFLPVVVFVIFLIRKRNWRGSLTEVVLFCAGAALAASPWVIRNGVRTGDFALDQPSQAAIMAQRYSSSIREAESLNFGSDSSKVAAHVWDYTLTHPGEVARFVGAHFINNELSTLSVLPLQASFDDYHDNFKVDTLFWLDGVKGVSGWGWLLLFSNIALISLGIGASVKRWGWAGVTPLLFHLAYSLSSALGRVSGWRFIQPVDWVGIFYFCLGFSEVLLWFFTVSNLSFSTAKRPVKMHKNKPRSNACWVVAFAAMILAGAVVPAAEWIIPKRYTSEVQAFALRQASGSDLLPAAIGSLETFMSQSGAVQMVGRTLYPRWYKIDAGEPGSGWAAYKPKQFAHLGFMLVGPGGEQQMVLNQADPPKEFTHAADVIIFGCKKPDYIDVMLVVGYNQSDVFAYKSDNLSHSCE